MYNPINAEEIAECIDNCQKAGIRVVTVNTKVKDSQHICFYPQGRFLRACPRTVCAPFNAYGSPFVLIKPTNYFAVTGFAYHQFFSLNSQHFCSQSVAPDSSDSFLMWWTMFSDFVSPQSSQHSLEKCVSNSLDCFLLV